MWNRPIAHTMEITELGIYILGIAVQCHKRSDLPEIWIVINVGDEGVGWGWRVLRGCIILPFNGCHYSSLDCEKIKTPHSNHCITCFDRHYYWYWIFNIILMCIKTKLRPRNMKTIHVVLSSIISLDCSTNTNRWNVFFVIKFTPKWPRRKWFRGVRGGMSSFGSPCVISQYISEVKDAKMALRGITT